MLLLRLSQKMTVLSSLKRQCGAESVHVHISLLGRRNARRVFSFISCFSSLRVAFIPIYWSLRIYIYILAMFDVFWAQWPMRARIDQDGPVEVVARTQGGT